MLVLAIESSTSSAKAVLFDTEKGIVGTGQKAYGTAIDHDGMTVPEKVFALSTGMAREVVENAGTAPEIAAIALCGTWHGLCACDGKMNPVTPVYSWNFTGTADICRRMREDRDLRDEIYRRTGCMPHNTYPRHILQYLQEDGVSLHDKKFVTQGGYNFYRLTGEFTESACTQSGSGIINLETKTYDSFVLSLTGVREEQFGALVTYRDAAPLTEEGARLLGLEPGIPVIPAHPDGALNQVGNYALKPGNMTLSVGTSGAIRLSCGRPVLPEGQELWCYLGVEKWIFGAAIAGACNCVNWFVDDFLGGRLSYSELEGGDEMPRHVPVFLPFLYGERCPGWDDKRQGGFVGIEPDMTVRDFYLGLQMGILFNMYQCYEALVREDGIPEKIYVSGGLTNSRRWLQMLADIFGKEIYVAEYPHASAMGAVALAMYQCGALEDLADFAEGEKAARRYEPDCSGAGWYEEAYARYLTAYNRCR